MRHRINVQPKDLTFYVNSDETILEAAQHQGVRFPHSCDAGACYVCAGKLVSGTLHLKVAEKDVTANTPDATDILFCLAQPRSNCTIVIEGVLAPGELPMFNVSCQVTHISHLDNDTLSIELRLPAGKKIDFYPGQYLQVILDNDTHCAFSIANTPNSERLINLYVGFSDKDERSKRLRKSFSVGNMIRVSLPHGDCYLKDPDSNAPLYLIAGSTGISQIMSIAEQCEKAQSTRDIHIYWGTKTAGELFLNDHLLKLAQRHDNIHYTPVVSEPDDTWSGRTGFVHNAMLSDGTISHHAEIILCGSPGMVYAVFDDFLAAGIQKEQVQSDVFDYAPRNK